MPFDELYSYYPLIASISAMAFSQIIKIIILILQNKTIKTDALTRSGGMPSSHSALITAITLSVGLKEGFDSSYFFLSVVLSLVVIYDARGIRHTVGTHAQVMNERILKNEYKKLNVNIGHTLPEIIVGIFIGLTTSFLMYHLLKF